MLVLGHRGASSTHPENTLHAFTAALALGADGVELDVRRTADGGLAVHHDPDLADGRPILGLATVDLPVDVPLLAAAYDAVAGATVVNTEIKNWTDDPDFDPSLALAERVVDLLRQRGELEDPRHLVTSFHLPTLDRVRALAPSVATGWLVIDPHGTDAVVTAASHGHRAIHPYHAFVTEELVDAAHGVDLAVNAWTVDDPDRIRWLRDVGVDAVITDDPAAALHALGR